MLLIQFESDKQAFILLIRGIIFSFVGWDLLIAYKLLLSIPLMLIDTAEVGLCSIHTYHSFDSNPTFVSFSIPSRT